MKVEDFDSGSDNELIADIIINLNLLPSESFNSVGKYGTGAGGSITLQFKVECDDNYYGLDCGTFCEDTDDNTGHFTCNSDGEKVCLSGWVEPSSNCLTPKSGLKNKLRTFQK